MSITTRSTDIMTGFGSRSRSNTMCENLPHEIQDIRNASGAFQGINANLEDVIKQLERQTIALQREFQELSDKCWPQTLKVRELQLAVLAVESQVPISLDDTGKSIQFTLREVASLPSTTKGSEIGEQETISQTAGASSTSTVAKRTEDPSSTENDDMLQMLHDDEETITEQWNKLEQLLVTASLHSATSTSEA